ncbi:uncharacterized protein LOC130815016 [Amaranthus tricolor]|uniref:uncharacterized protein LOC130815016 n=1 Tax=Amaranthus tricolor TaxID=29722 RepID=UPI002582ACA5|nr:uncharacterized protein LOC130815016 [Amaranthus tricolor]
MMNASIKSILINPQANSNFLYIKSAFFHSTTFLERARRNYWHIRNNNSNKSRWSDHRRNPFKRKLMRDTNAYVEYMFQSCKSDWDQDNQPFDRGPAWFKNSYNGSGKNRSNTRGHQKSGRRGYTFCEEDDDDDVETIFRSAFGDRFIFWSFVNQDYSHWRSSSHSTNNNSWRRRRRQQYEYEDEDDDDENFTSADNTRKSAALASERTALGLSASGPLKLEDVKNAYRTCALKWHPDRHLGSSKAAAEEKFKLCTAAYQSLCDRLASN